MLYHSPASSNFSENSEGKGHTENDHSVVGTDNGILYHDLNMEGNDADENIQTENDVSDNLAVQDGNENTDIHQNNIENDREGLHTAFGENELIDFIKRKENNIVDDLLKDTEQNTNWNIDADEDILELDDIDQNMLEDDIQAADRPIQPGHPLTLKTSVLLIWLFAITHSISLAELGDLLSLINLHLIMSSPAYQSVYRFKNFFSNVKLPTKKHFFCCFCGSPVEENQMLCLNVKCHKPLNDKNSKSHFIELDLKSQLKIFFKRKDFLEGLKHRFYRSKKNMKI